MPHSALKHTFPLCHQISVTSWSVPPLWVVTAYFGMVMTFLNYLCLALLSPYFELPFWPSVSLNLIKVRYQSFKAALNACVPIGHASLFHVLQILSVRKVSNRGTSALPILNQAHETECCDIEQLIHPAQSLQSDLRDPQGDLRGPIDLWPSFLTRSILIFD
jgi:hypothetical protein